MGAWSARRGSASGSVRAGRLGPACRTWVSAGRVAVIEASPHHRFLSIGREGYVGLGLSRDLRPFTGLFERAYPDRLQPTMRRGTALLLTGLLLVLVSAVVLPLVVPR